jgi:hypothetical protein
MTTMRHERPTRLLGTDPEGINPARRDAGRPQKRGTGGNAKEGQGKRKKKDMHIFYKTKMVLQDSHPIASDRSLAKIDDFKKGRTNSVPYNRPGRSLKLSLDFIPY